MIFYPLPNLQFLFWIGWIVSAALFICFATGVVFDSLFKKDVFSDSTPFLPNHSNSSKFRFFPALMVISAVLFIIAFINRCWLSKFMFGPWYFTDEIIETCINPFKLTQGENTWGGILTT